MENSPEPETTSTPEESSKPQFLRSLVTPLEDRVEMGRMKLPKMCSCWSYGS
jgi:hypothetical protein